MSVEKKGFLTIYVEQKGPRPETVMWPASGQCMAGGSGCTSEMNE
jgi:hypothetical protein